ncbi:D-isomer specific 2-hydroxyacid dehydrogenase [Protomyces lactucae-debilis]|uniref:D-isomer specific 2-hydroxyacid dehydrogenase n=1 Tax=Protomyces lactucae-debilis TaxID=2754530 RepID=A0A1Y2ESQ1_PROLT|nr:D-isomer specific 2-hydroxyacid dehydrogenase [Protomyces lactucae-debilis]ORY74601.1 D-isomer specific 2-hydroxyacid dehydrogenase [Protomyces lactucae-debilis]
MIAKAASKLGQVLVCGDIKFASKQLKDLQTKASVTLHPMTTRAAFLEACHQLKPAAIYRPLDTTATIGKFDSDLLKALPQSVKFVAHNGAGYDQIDVYAAGERGIKVSNTPEVVSRATADTAMFLMLGAVRQFAAPLRSCHEGNWRAGLATGRQMGRDPHGQIVGIIGMGGIGRQLAHRCRAFGMQVQYHNRTQLSAEKEDGARYVSSLSELLASSDVVSLNLPLNAKTRHFISHKEIAQMKTGAVLVNTARGPVLDEAALVEALESGKLAGAGLDVYEEEPKIHLELLKSSRVCLLPHIGTVSQETQEALEVLVLANIESALESGKLLTPVPEHA